MRNSILFALFIGVGACLVSCNQKKLEGFSLISPAESGVDFINEITENDSLNILVSEFVYNGGGVGIGDLNGDELPDLFFCGNQVSNGLFLNLGNLKFQNITSIAGIEKRNPLEWSSGVNILDINLDGRKDIYVSNTLRKDSTLRRNLLFINQGNNENGVPTFKEASRAYGVDNNSHSSHSQFFDYDNDGDLDLFIGVNVIEGEYPNQFVDIKMDGTGMNRDLLLRNDWDNALGHPVFTDVSLQAGLLQDGYSHSTLIHDFNQDGWQDIYVANDYQSNDLVFINNQDGTFTNRASEVFKHFSLSAMGSDVSDINNDGQADFFTSEMQPYYNKRKKLFQGGSSYQSQLLTEKYGYDYQYTRNTLQLNQGTDPNTGLPIYAEIGMYARVQETDWSWSTLFADYDNDGWKDLFIANGFPRDVTDRDFADFRAMASNLVSHEELYEAIPQIKIPNFLFKNNRDLTFSNVTQDWNLGYASFSNGAAYGDLDLDGDLDLVINNIDDPAYIFENKIQSGNYLRVALEGPKENPDAYGATIRIKQNELSQTNYLISGRGYLSKSENVQHFGLGVEQVVDTLEVIWPDGQVSVLVNVSANQTVRINHQGALSLKKSAIATIRTSLFDRLDNQAGLNYKNEEIDFVDFNFQRTLAHKYSQYGPSVSVADINGDQLDDVFIGGSGTFSETWMIQGADGTFVREDQNFKQHPKKYEEDTGSLLFDADNDGDQDLYIVRGSAQFRPGDALYQDVLWINDGNGNFELAENALPAIQANGACVKGADFDQDGDIDLFVGSRVLPISFPLPDRSYLLRNDSENGVPKFTDVTETIAASLVEPGMVSDALWTDFNNDNWPDLILAMEWSSIKVFENQAGGTFVDVTSNSGIESYAGWWNSLSAADLDQDGDMDYIAGNFGENLYYRCSSDRPIKVYGKDLDANGMVDPLISCYWQDSLGQFAEYLYHPRQDLIKQFVGIRKKYNTYAEYGEATVPEMFSSEEMEGALILDANWMKSSIIENLGDGQFRVHALPKEAQLAPVYGILSMDVNHDSKSDLILIGNDFGMEVQQGRADAFNGLVLLNEGDWRFNPLSIAESGFLVRGDGVGLAQLVNAKSEVLLLAMQNRDSLRTFRASMVQEQRVIPLTPNEVKVKYYLSNGQVKLEEKYFGSGFMAQSSRVILNPSQYTKIEIMDTEGVISRVLE